MGLCLVWSILLCQHMCFLHSGLSFLLNTPGSHQCIIADVAIGHCALSSCCPTQLPHLLSNSLPFSAQYTHCNTVAVPLPNSQSVLPSPTSFTMVMVVPCTAWCLSHCWTHSSLYGGNTELPLWSLWGSPLVGVSSLCF